MMTDMTIDTMMIATDVRITTIGLTILEIGETQTVEDETVANRQPRARRTSLVEEKANVVSVHRFWAER
jgi:hypothetical protein